MLLAVVRTDGRHDYVKDFILDLMLETRQIVKFRRQSGWVNPEVDPLRTHWQRRAAPRSDRRRVSTLSKSG